MSTIDRELPDERSAPSGLLKVYRRISGPDTSGPEVTVQLVGVLAFTALAVGIAAARAPGWSVLQWVLAAGFAFDFGGGVVTNATRSAKRWYHPPGRSRLKPLLFCAAHVHPFAVAWAFGLPWGGAVALYAGTLAAVAIVELAPRSIAQPVAFCAVALGLVATGAVSGPLGLEWFAPVYLLKLVGAYAVPAEEEVPARGPAERRPRDAEGAEGASSPGARTRDVG